MRAAGAGPVRNGDKAIGDAVVGSNAGSAEMPRPQVCRGVRERLGHCAVDVAAQRGRGGGIDGRTDEWMPEGGAVTVESEQTDRLGFSQIADRATEFGGRSRGCDEIAVGDGGDQRGALRGFRQRRYPTTERLSHGVGNGHG